MCENTSLPQCLSSNPSGAQTPDRGSLIEPTATDIVEPSLHTAGSAQKWIAIAMDLVETQRPNSGQQIGIEGDCRGRSGTIVINESGEEKDNKINKHERAVAKSQPNTSSESLVVEERREQTN